MLLHETSCYRRDPRLGLYGVNDGIRQCQKRGRCRRYVRNRRSDHRRWVVGLFQVRQEQDLPATTRGHDASTVASGP